MEEVGTVVHFRNEGSVNYRLVIAGPNGEGKTTFAHQYPPEITLVRRIWPLPQQHGHHSYYQYAYFDDGRHVEIKRTLWRVTTPVNKTSSYRVVHYARNDTPP
jgi:hypothetical protein